MCGKDSAVDPSAGIGDISDRDHICNRSKTDQACIGQENDDKKDQIDQKLGCSKCQSDMGDYSLRTCRTWICTEMDLDQPGESWMRTPSMTMISLFLNFSGLANQFNFFIDTSSRYKK